jgi:hypothetical protein
MEKGFIGEIGDDNQPALEFWQANGWKILDYDYRTLQRNLMIDIESGTFLRARYLTEGFSFSRSQSVGSFFS